jgi:hypothetical protein
VFDGDVGRLSAIGPDDAFRASQQIEHLVGIVFVDLAPEGADEDFLGHGEPPIAAVGGGLSQRPQWPICCSSGITPCDCSTQ